MNVFDYLFEETQDIDKDFVIGPKETISFKKLYEDSLKVASFLKNNIGQDQNVILISQNSVFFITAYLGILKSGNVCVPLNYDLEQSNLDYVTRLTDCTTTFIAGNLQAKLKFEEVIDSYNEEDLSQILKTQQKEIFTSVFNVNSVAEILFTSGSTGAPKGVMISHQNIIANTNSIEASLKLSSKDILCVVLPFYYCYGLSLLHTHLKVGGSLVLNNGFMFLGSFIDNLKLYECTGFSGVPSHFQILLKKSQTFKDKEFPDLRYVTQAGGKLHSIFIEEFVEAFPKTEFYVMYGQTEATARLSCLPPELIKSKLESIGKGIPGVTLKIVNEKGGPVGIDEEGELLAFGENIMLGYFKDVLASKDTVKNGWLHTGDIAKIDKDGFYYLVARKKEFIKTGGKRVSPKEIEGAILSVPEVVDCTITGVDDAILGEAIQATIVLNGKLDNELMKNKILQKCSENLSPYKIPHQISFETSLQMSATGKKIKK